MLEIYGLIKNWGLKDVEQIESVNKESGSTKFIATTGESGKYLLKSVHNEARIEVEEDLLQYLASLGIRVLVPLRTVDDRLVVEHGSNKYCLYEYIEGEHLEYDTIEKLCFAAERLGEVLGLLHKALQNYNNESEHIKDMNLYNTIFKWALPLMGEKMEGSDIFRAIDERRENLKKVFERNSKQFIHRDFHGENVMFKDGEFIGVIDFELCMIGYRIFDIAYLMTSMLVGNFKNKEYRLQWLSAIPILLESYDKVKALTIEERQDIFYMFISVQLIFTAYYLNMDKMEESQSNLEMCKWFLENERGVLKRLQTEE